MNDRPRVLILGGTGDGRALATEAAGRFTITYSLAGRTREPVLPDAVEQLNGLEFLSLDSNKIALFISFISKSWFNHFYNSNYFFPNIRVIKKT